VRFLPLFALEVVLFTFSLGGQAVLDVNHVESPSGRSSSLLSSWDAAEGSRGKIVETNLVSPISSRANGVSAGAEMVRWAGAYDSLLGARAASNAAPLHVLPQEVP
jgi:hypothetical protein